jgi:hypothetical protein
MFCPYLANKGVLRRSLITLRVSNILSRGVRQKKAKYLNYPERYLTQNVQKPIFGDVLCFGSVGIEYVSSTLVCNSRSVLGVLVQEVQYSGVLLYVVLYSE